MTSTVAINLKFNEKKGVFDMRWLFIDENNEYDKTNKHHNNK